MTDALRLKALITFWPLMASSAILLSSPRPILQVSKSFSRVLCHESREPEHDGHHQDACQCKPMIEHEHGDEDPQHGNHACHQRRDVLRDCLVDGVDIVGEAAHETARGVRVEKAHGKRLDVGEKVSAYRLECPLRDAGHDPVGGHLERIAQDIHREHEHGDSEKAREILSADELVDGNAHEVGAAQTEKGIEQNKAKDEANGQPKMA